MEVVTVKILPENNNEKNIQTLEIVEAEHLQETDKFLPAEKSDIQSDKKQKPEFLDLPEKKLQFQSPKFIPERKLSVLLEFPVEHLDPDNHDLENIADQKPKTGCRKYAGVLFALMAGLCFTLSTLIVKALENHPLSLSFWRYFGFIIPTIPMSLYYVYIKKENIFSSVWPLIGDGSGQKRKTLFFVWLSSLCGCTTFLLRFYSLLYLSLADATVIAFSGPVVIVIFGHFCLGEKCGIVTIPIALWTLIGVFVIARPPVLTGESEFSDSTLIGIALALSSVLFIAFYFIIMRKLRQVHLAIVSIAAGITGLVESIIIATAMGVLSVPEGTREILLITAMACLSFTGQMFIVSALKWEQAGTVSLVRTSDVIFAFIWQLIFLNAIPDIFSYLGAFIVVIGVLLTTFRKLVSTLPAQHRIRRIFGFLLK